ncbi:MAG: alpha/beta fold hydrolase [Alphaproteobacteria bacterium]|nr:alpha/beta fold hydrolase [Alphaproteobacteria bacterium]
MSTDSKTFVLVHGTAHGGWCWVRVADRLRALGHKVFTPTLTGVGERSHLMSADVNLDTHITDVVNVIKWEELTDVVLCGHSYGGWVISGVVEQVPDEITSIVYLDAFMPEDGDQGTDTQSPGSKEAVERALAAGEHSRIAGSAAQYGLTGDDLAWVDSKLTPQPIGVSLQPIRLTGARDRVPMKSFILSRGYNNPAFVASYEARKSDPSWRLFDLPCHHDIMVEMPDELTEILIEVA